MALQVTAVPPASEVLDRTLRKSPSAEALLGADGRYTYVHVKAAARHAAAVLARLGVRGVLSRLGARPGDRAAASGGNGTGLGDHHGCGSDDSSRPRHALPHIELARYKVPDVIAGSLPRTSMGKVRRNETQSLFFEDPQETP